jgi:cytosine/creatinine deaminase
MPRRPEEPGPTDRAVAADDLMPRRPEEPGPTDRAVAADDRNSLHVPHMRAAYEQALASYRTGGLPIGAVMVASGVVVAAGHNQRVQQGDPIAHGEMDCIRKAGRRSRYDDVTLYTTLSPCMMCAGTIVQFGIPRVVVGEDRNFRGNTDFLRSHGVDVLLLDDADCISLMRRFITERPDLWDEDIAGRE